MEKQKLPNSTAFLVLGILSLVSFILCFCYGLGLILPIILGIIALILSVSPTKMHKQDPDLYEGYQNVKTGKILAILAIILNVLIIVFVAWVVSIIGWELIQSGDQEAIQEAMNEYFGLQ